MATVKEILDRYRLIGAGDDVQRTEVMAAGQPAQISDPAQGILPWDTYLGQAVPDNVLEQVAAVRAMLPNPQHGRVPMAKDAGEFMLTTCDRSVCVMFTDTSEYRKKMAADIQADADALKAERDAEADEETRLKLHVRWMKTVAYKHLMKGREGPSSAINTYDKAIFTWGMGFAATGGLKKVLSRIHQIEKLASADLNQHYVQKLFYLCGFKFQAGRFWVVDLAKKKVYADEKPITAAEDNAFRYIHDTLDLHAMWTLAARDDLTRKAMLDAQRDIFFEATGDVALAGRVKTSALYTLLAHLQHWTGDTTLELVGYAFGPDATPRVSSAYPSEQADAEIAIQAIHRFYRWRRPDFDKNDFGQVRKYWSEMREDAKEEGATGFDPQYAIMTADPVDAIPEGHFGGKRKEGRLWDLGPCEDFHRKADGTPETPPPQGKAASPPQPQHSPPPIPFMIIPPPLDDMPRPEPDPEPEPSYSWWELPSWKFW
jgi:hypothetical protein